MLYRNTAFWNGQGAWRAFSIDWILAMIAVDRWQNGACNNTHKAGIERKTMKEQEFSEFSPVVGCWNWLRSRLEEQEFSPVAGRWNWLRSYLKTRKRASLPLSNITLLYGRDGEGRTVHLYLLPEAREVVQMTYKKEDGEVQLVSALRYSADGFVQEAHFARLASQLNLLPAACDLHFCRWLNKRGVALSFLPWSELDTESTTAASGIYGFTLPIMGKELIGRDSLLGSYRDRG